MKKIYAYAFGLCLALSAAGCQKKESDQATPTPTLTAKETLLTAKNWRLTTIVGTTTFAGNTITTDGYAQLQACQKDNFVKYNADKTAVHDEGATKCSTSDPQTQNVTWSLNAAETELTVTGTTNGTVQAVKAELLQLTATSMQIRTSTTQTQSGFTIVSTATSTYAAF